jgi:hypothetical protein
MTITRTTIARRAREIAQDELSYASWSHRGNNPLAVSEARHIGLRKAWDELIPAYAWPGGYDVAYYIEGAYDLTGDVLCADCAREFIRTNRPADGYDVPKLAAESCDSYEGNDSADHLLCDECYRIIARAWCREEGHRDDRDLPRAEWVRLYLEQEHGVGDNWSKYSRAGHRRAFIRSPYNRFGRRSLRPEKNLHAARPELTRYGGRKAIA